MSTNLKRFVSGVIYVFLILFSIEKGFFNFLILGFSFLCMQEFLIFSSTKSLISLNLSLFLTLLFVEFLFEGSVLYEIICLVFYISISFISFLFSSLSHTEKIRQLSSLFFAWIYILLPTLIVTYMYSNSGSKLILCTFIFIWTNDTFSFFVGKKWGKTKIFPHISSLKSLEGYLGGLFFSLLAGVAFYFYWDEVYWIFFGGGIAILASLGDLLESMIKRVYGVKDSGNLFPGHGGFLDRLDSFIFVVPIVFIFYLILKK